MPATTHNALKLGTHSILTYGPVSFTLGSGDNLCLPGGKPLPKPYTGTVVRNGQGRRHYIMVLTGIPATASLPVLTLHSGRKKQRLPRYAVAQMEEFLNFYTALPPDAQQAIFHLLTRGVKGKELSLLPSLTLELQRHVHCPRWNVTYAAFLTPQLLYIETKVKHGWPAGENMLTLHAPSRQITVPAAMFRLDQEHAAGVALLGGTEEETCHLTLWQGVQPVVLQGNVNERAHGITFMQMLNTKPDYQKHVIREQICRQLLAHAPLDDNARGLMQNLQRFVTPSPQYCNDLAQPFAMHIDHCITAGNEGLFLTGWMRDPHQMLEEVEAQSDLGFSLTLKERMFRFARPDVVEAFKHTPHGNVSEKYGFACYVPVPEALRQAMGELTLHAFRFLIRLKGGAVLHLAPQTKQYDPFAARELVLKFIPAVEVNEAMFAGCISPAAAALQRLCMVQVAVKEELVFGKLPKKPKISLVVPLYRRLEFLRLQFALMANDPDKNQCELVYVLDSPEQEAEAQALFADLSQLYGVSARLVVMARNSGYAAATHAGALRAQGEYLVLMNSDVIPRTPGWAGKMAAFYARKKNIGALGAKLLYADGALQHAGMYFEKTVFPFWENAHFFKGYPGAYVPAQENRAVAAVTGACLMISAERYRAIGGISHEYIVGDFEDSDLCLRCSERGWENWYFAEAELVHLERQSVSMHQEYQGSLAWRYNARLHSEQWDARITQIMQETPEEDDDASVA